MLDSLERIAQKTVLTRYPGHATEVALEGQAYGGVVAVGGDGTLFEILKGFDRANQRIAIIPAGRGNSLAHDLGLMHGGAFAGRMNWERVRTIDLLEVCVTTADGVESTHVSASTIAVGYPSAVVRRARKMAWMGKISYAAATAFVSPKHFNARIQYEGGRPREARLSGFIANNTRYLANFLAFHQGNCSDGRFEIMEMNAARIKQTAHNLSALSGSRAYEPYPSLQAKRAQVWLETPRELMIDGEILPGVVAMKIRILPSALACNGWKPQ